MAKRRLRAYNASALYIHMTPELLKLLKTKLIMLQLPEVQIKLTTYRNQNKYTKRSIKLNTTQWLEGKLTYPDLCKAGDKIEAYWTFTVTQNLPF